MNIGDKVVGVCGAGRELGVVTEIDLSDRWPIQVKYDDGCFGRYLVDEIKPLVNRTWNTTQADIDCHGRY